MSRQASEFQFKAMSLAYDGYDERDDTEEKARATFSF